MKRIFSLCILLALLTGCSQSDARIERCMGLRSKLLAGGCSFTAEITADYGDKLHTFTLECTGNDRGDLCFTVVSPESISGITGEITGGGGAFTYDGDVLYFDLMADGTLSPVSAPWILLKTLRGGYLTSAGSDGDLLMLTIDDSYAEDALHLDVWLDEQDVPVRCEILYDGRRILSVNIGDFSFQ